QIIARLMAKEDQLNAEQKATLDKLAGEYADELANLGVRVGNLEKKVGNIYWSGDARMRYRDNSVGNDTWDGRMRINVKGQVNDTTTVNGHLTYNMNFKDSTKDSGVYMDTLNVKHQFGDFAVTLGRYANNFGNEYSWRFGDSHNFDGAELSYAKDAFNAKVGFGQWDTDYTVDQKAAMDDQDAFYAKAGYDFNFAKLGVDYVKFQGNNTAKQSFSGNDELLGVDLSIPFAQKWAVLGEYVKNTNTQFSKDDAWNAGISYGVANWKKPGTFNINVMYNDIGGATYFGGTGIGTDMLGNLKDGNKELKFWNIGTDVTLAKNVQLHGEYAFDADLTNSEDPDDAWTVSLNYKF
ncbi:S-layer protein, partial [uncultured Dialister sp.]|uniref:S-layer protein n=1 Tax=uncultured Dialister sp. TaxID=278064 RepID=UPI0025E408B0